jgi:hypothetical protein
MKKNKITLLIGSASVGKSTYIKNNYADKDKYLILAFDDIKLEILEEYNANLNIDLGFDDFWQHPPEDSKIGDIHGDLGIVEEITLGNGEVYLSYPLVNEMNEKYSEKVLNTFKECANTDKQVIVDVTNMTAEQRKDSVSNITRLVPDKEFEIEAIDLSVQSVQSKKLVEILALLRSYSLKGDKRDFMDPESISESVNRYEVPTLEEGLDKIITMSQDNRDEQVLDILKYMTNQVLEVIASNNPKYNILDLLKDIDYSLSMDNNFGLENIEEFNELYMVVVQQARLYIKQQINNIADIKDNKLKLETLKSLKGIPGSTVNKLYKEILIEIKLKKKEEVLNDTEEVQKGPKI